VPRKRTRFDWATDSNESIGPVPTSSDFHPTKVPSPLVRPIPAPRLLANPITPAQPGYTPPRPTITASNDIVAPRTCTPATDTPYTRTPVSHTKYHAPSTAPPQVPAERAPTTIVHGPRDLSALRSGAPNPWASLRRRHNGHYARVPRQFTRQRQHPPIYPANRHLHTTLTPKPPTPAPNHIFETVRHPHGIGPTKPVIRVPVQNIPASLAPHKPIIRVPTRVVTDSSTDLAPPIHHPIAKSAPPALPLQSSGAVQCQCGQLVRVSDPLRVRNIPLHHTLHTFISNFFSPLSFPSLFFSRFRLS
jgi:hypothetical protein